MRGIKKSIYRRILGGFILIIIFTTLFSSWIEYRSIKKQLQELLTKIRSENISHILGVAYQENGSWETINSKIIEYETQQAGTDGDLTLRIVVKDNQDRTLYNSFINLEKPENIPLIKGNSTPVYNYNSGEIIGNVIIYINRYFIENEAGKYLQNIIRPRIYQGLIIIFISIVIAAILSKRISSPVTALTRATKDIIEKGDNQLLEVKSSDELGQMSESFNKMTQFLQTQRDLRKRLISDVAHEINSPLNLIRLEARGIIDNLKPGRIAAQQIIEDVDRLNNLINDLNWLAETDSGVFQLKIEECSYKELLENETGHWRMKAEKSRINLKLEEIPKDIPKLKIDKSRISQVLGNLIENSIKNTPSGGSITIKCCTGNNHIITSVCDTGGGINEKDLPFIFERFYRTDTSRRQSTGGRGLGLSIAKRIMELHCGTIRAENNKGKGSCFYIRLPLTDKKP